MLLAVWVLVSDADGVAVSDAVTLNEGLDDALFEMDAEALVDALADGDAVLEPKRTRACTSKPALGVPSPDTASKPGAAPKPVQLHTACVHELFPCTTSLNAWGVVIAME